LELVNVFQFYPGSTKWKDQLLSLSIYFLSILSKINLSSEYPN